MENQQIQQKLNRSICQVCGHGHSYGGCACQPYEFLWKYGGQNVQIYGSWNKWQAPINMKERNEPPHFFSTIISLQAGTYQYKYFVDGKWCFDLNEEVIFDGYGGSNNQVEILPINTLAGDVTDESEKEKQSSNSEEHKVDNKIFSHDLSKNQPSRQIRIRTNLEGENIWLMGSWDKWSSKIPMVNTFNQLTGNYQHEAILKLSKGTYTFKFLINGAELKHDPNLKFVPNEFGGYNNYIKIQDQQTGGAHQISPSCLGDPFNINVLSWSTKWIGNLGWHNIQGHSLTVIGDFIYLFGGGKLGDNTDRMFSISIHTFDLETVDYQNKAPIGRSYHQAVPFGNKVVIYGGVTKIGYQQKPLQDLHFFDTVTKIWEKQEMKGNIPSLRERNTLCFQKYQRFFVFGGYYWDQQDEQEHCYNDLYALDLQTLIWNRIKTMEKAALPEPRFAHTAKIVLGQMYVFGGMQKQTNLPQVNFNDTWRINVQKLDKNIKWEHLTNLIKGEAPTPRHGHIMIKMQQFLVIHGGKGQIDNNDVVFSDLFVLDTKKLEWIKPKVDGDPPSGRFFHTGARTKNNQLVLFGGSIGGSISQKNSRIYILQSSSVIKHQEKQFKDEMNQARGKNQEDSLSNPKKDYKTIFRFCSLKKAELKLTEGTHPKQKAYFFDGIQSNFQCGPIKLCVPLTITATLKWENVRVADYVLDLKNSNELDNITLYSTLHKNQLVLKIYNEKWYWFQVDNFVVEKQWVHLAISINDKSQICFFKNGKLQQHHSGCDDLGLQVHQHFVFKSGERTNCYIGRSNKSNTNFFSGYIQSISIFGEALSQEAIYSLYRDEFQIDMKEQKQDAV